MRSTLPERLTFRLMSQHLIDQAIEANDLHGLEAATPEMPDDFDIETQTVWDRLIGFLEPAGHITAIDGLHLRVLTLLVRRYQRMTAHSRVIARTGNRMAWAFYEVDREDTLLLIAEQAAGLLLAVVEVPVEVSAT